MFSMPTFVLHEYYYIYMVLPYLAYMCGIVCVLHVSNMRIIHVSATHVLQTYIYTCNAREGNTPVVPI